VGNDGQWQELQFGLLAAGEVLIDDIQVTENPTGDQTELIQNGDFEGGAPGWRLLGNHRHSEVITDPENSGNRVLHLVATGPTEHMHNHIERTLSSEVYNGREYEVTFRARWLGGDNQINTRLYLNRVAKTTRVRRPDSPGTPGAPNSRAASNIGPTYSELKHQPAVPAAGEAVTVSVKAEDPDGIESMSLVYRLDEGSQADQVPMVVQADGAYAGTIPGQTASALVQFFVLGQDAAGAQSAFPARAEESGAFYRVDDGQAADTGVHNLRILIARSNTEWMHTDINVMSNDRLPGTVIYREQEAYYDVGVRLKGSERGRTQQNRVGFNVRFGPGHAFRDVHRTVSIDRSEADDVGQQELLYNIMMTNSGEGPGKYNDLVRVIAPDSAHTSFAELQLARYGAVFLNSQFQNGSRDGQLFEYELIYYPTSADDNGFKRPQPDSVAGTPIRDLGDDKENYRWNYLTKNNRDEDDFGAVVAFAKHFSESGSAFLDGLEAIGR
jgi:hypothetical protein